MSHHCSWSRNSDVSARRVCTSRRQLGGFNLMYPESSLDPYKICTAMLRRSIFSIFVFTLQTVYFTLWEASKWKTPIVPLRASRVLYQHCGLVDSKIALHLYITYSRNMHDCGGIYCGYKLCKQRSKLDGKWVNLAQCCTVIFIPICHVWRIAAITMLYIFIFSERQY